MTTGLRPGAGRLEAACWLLTATEDYQLIAICGAAGGSERGLDEVRGDGCDRVAMDATASRWKRPHFDAQSGVACGCRFQTMLGASSCSAGSSELVVFRCS